MSSSQQIQSLSNQFNTILSEYQSTYNDFINTINSDDNSFTTVDNNAFNGSNIINTTTATNVSDCSTFCSSNTSCSGATFTSNNNNCTLSSGNGNIIKTINSTAIVKKAMYYSYQLQNLNQQLIDINEEINNNINQSYNSYQKNLNEVSERDQALQQNYIVLTEERENIKRIVREYETLNSAQENGDINATMNYYNYIILVFIVLLLIFLLLRFSISSEQSGGSGLHKILKNFFGYH
jgi:lipopolysaccharide export LptBFGC system permease protein LptF